LRVYPDRRPFFDWRITVDPEGEAAADTIDVPDASFGEEFTLMVEAFLVDDAEAVGRTDNRNRVASGLLVNRWPVPIPGVGDGGAYIATIDHLPRGRYEIRHEVDGQALPELAHPVHERTGIAYDISYTEWDFSRYRSRGPARLQFWYLRSGEVGR